MPNRPITFFIAGIMQGSKVEKSLHEQEYRPRLKSLLEETVADADVYCPLENNGDSLNYTPSQGRQVFLDHIEQAGDTDVVISYIPVASMGTALEMWRAWEQNRLVLTITPMRRNWVVKFLSTRIFADLDEFETCARSGDLERLIHDHLAQRAAAPAP